MCCAGTFSPYTVVNEATCVKIHDWLPLDKSALVGCGVTTGSGAANYSADVQSGDSVVVICLVGIGFHAFHDAAMPGFSHFLSLHPVVAHLRQAPYLLPSSPF